MWSFDSQFHIVKKYQVSTISIEFAKNIQDTILSHQTTKILATFSAPFGGKKNLLCCNNMLLVVNHQSNVTFSILNFFSLSLSFMPLSLNAVSLSCLSLQHSVGYRWWWVLVWVVVLACGLRCKFQHGSLSSPCIMGCAVVLVLGCSMMVLRWDIAWTEPFMNQGGQWPNLSQI